MAADGGKAGAPHVPVMLGEVLQALDPQPGETIVDATLGAAGYTRAVLERGARVVAFDRDPTAIAAARALDLDRLTLVHDRFSRIADHVERADGVVMDVGVSSMQIDAGERGFSFRHDGPLDMRMSGEGLSAADAVNRLPRAQLTRIIGLLGEERQAARVAAAIERARPLETTGTLAAAVRDALPPARGGIDPATRTFQALRVFVNRELPELAEGLLAAERVLVPGGRLVVVAFHSLEDRIVKRFLLDRAGGAGGSRHMPDAAPVPATFEPLGRAVAPSDAEVTRNPRARSARLRAARRTDAPARPMPPPKQLGLPDLSSAYRELSSGHGELSSGHGELESR